MKDPSPQDLRVLNGLVMVKVPVNGGAMAALWKASVDDTLPDSAFEAYEYNFKLPFVLLINVPSSLIKTLAFV